jgi:hypothetical protein
VLPKGNDAMSDGVLPVEYVPMSRTNMKAGDAFDDVTYRLRESSHAKTLEGLINSLPDSGRSEVHYSSLLPSEHWGLARVLCRTFGRLNEVAIGGAAWDIFGLAEIGSTLRSRARILGTSWKRGLAFCDTLHETFDADSDRLLLRCRDRMILTHDCTKPFFFEPEPVVTELPAELLYDRRHVVYHRYPWDPSLWENNIHVDDYAQACGFARGLPEFVTYMDWIYHIAMQSAWQEGRPLSIKFQKVLPMYLGDSPRVVSWAEGDCLQVRFLKDGEERVVAKVLPLAAEAGSEASQDLSAEDLAAPH